MSLLPVEAFEGRRVSSRQMTFCHAARVCQGSHGLASLAASCWEIPDRLGRSVGWVLGPLGLVQTCPQILPQHAWRFGDGPAGRGGRYQAVCGGAGRAVGVPAAGFHGGPGLDHTEFGDYLDPLAEGGRYRLVLADERACGRSDRTAPARHGRWGGWPRM